eukprot:CAMPEP_0185918816 /NCGR_PEP_ID=MMETSP0924C-20121207/6212_1 /TAXON_ID=321610 /ORGANISM="Perkinsus chesapeaki, Strain ATCC PRA-65" /LENGTH=59 /DNA_ID=CAMNT_0028647043 /DNA_START=1 /DNA_END=177 /DNA_ORIENTATION=-
MKHNLLPKPVVTKPLAMKHANTINHTVCWLTGGAWNAMMANFMSDVGVHLSWGQWAYSM